MPKMYECNVQLGSRSNRLSYWVKGVRWSGDSIVVDLSPDQCFIPGKLSRSITPLLECAVGLPSKRWMVSCTDSDAPYDPDAHPELTEKYKALIREFVRIFGRDQLLALLEGRNPAPSEEVPGNE